MSYHTHNLEEGDVFAGPLSMLAYALGDWMDMPQHLFEVLDVEHSAYMAPDYRWLSGRLDKDGHFLHLVARCLHCDIVMNEVVSRDVSLCMVEEDELEDRVARWACS